MFGRLENSSSTNLTIPGLPGNPTIPVAAELSGDLYGFGGTLAAGTESYFLSLDANWSRADLGEPACAEEQHADCKDDD